MRRKKFFENLGNILIFGLAVTLVCFIIYTGLSWIVLKYMNLHMRQHVEERYEPVSLTVLQLMLFTSLLCSSDVVAAVSIVDYNAQPKLFSCIFGEGVTNDIVSIVLFNVVTRLQEFPFDAMTPLIILGQFLSIAIVSIVIGVFFGFLTSLMFKHMRWLTSNAVTETFIMLAIGFISYFLA